MQRANLWGLGSIFLLALSSATFAQKTDITGAVRDNAAQQEAKRKSPQSEKLARARKDFFAAQRAEQRLQDLGWKLASGNAPYCPDAPLSVGLVLQDARAFGSPEIVRKIVGRPHDFTVRAVASGSPADRAGLTPNLAILAVDGVSPTDWPVDASKIWERAYRAQEFIAASLAQDGSVELTVEGGVKLTIPGVPVCATQFEMQSRGDTAVADGERVRFGREFPAFAYPDDEFAAIIAHELAHNLLNHPEWLAKKGRRNNRVRATEREADRMMPWLLANAGFEPEAALRFMERWGPDHAGGKFRKRTHDSWRERAATIAAEVASVRATIEEGGEANWAVTFKREIAPQPAPDEDA